MKGMLSGQSCGLSLHRCLTEIYMDSQREQIMEKFQIVYAGLTNLRQHSTTDLARGIMTNESKQSMLLKTF